MDTLRKELLRQRREGHSFSIVLVDIDHFKNVNDTFGHLCGDEVLQAVARRMKDCMRTYDTIGRYGGEEFLIVAPAADPSGAMGLAERIRKVFELEAIPTKAGEVHITASLGVAVHSDPSHVDAHELLHRADEALYQAKERGRNCAVLSGSSELASVLRENKVR
jgi:diguanylate cyclase (GGDEF)-like protein